MKTLFGVQVWEYFVTYSNPSFSASKKDPSFCFNANDSGYMNVSVRPSPHLVEPLKRLEEKLITAVEAHIALLNSENSSQQPDDTLRSAVCGLYIQFMTECQSYAR